MISEKTVLFPRLKRLIRNVWDIVLNIFAVILVLAMIAIPLGFLIRCSDKANKEHHAMLDSMEYHIVQYEGGKVIGDSMSNRQPDEDYKTNRLTFNDKKTGGTITITGNYQSSRIK